MKQVRAAAQQTKAVSAGMLMLVSTAVALTQLTSLALGPAASRQLNLSVALPAVDIEDASTSLGSPVDAVLGTIVIAGPGLAHQTFVAAPSTSSPGRPAGSSSVAIPGETIFVSNGPVATTSERSVTAGNSGHDDRGHERGTGKRPSATD
jgi:hypothetical protein